MNWLEPAATFTGVAMLLLIFLFAGYHIGQARSADSAAYDDQIEAEAPGAGELTQDLPEPWLNATDALGRPYHRFPGGGVDPSGQAPPNHPDRLADAGDGQALTSGPAPGGASAAADTLTRSAAAPGWVPGESYLPGEHWIFMGELRAALDPPELGTAAGQGAAPLLLADTDGDLYRADCGHYPAYLDCGCPVTVTAGTAAGRALLIGMGQAEMSTEIFRSPLVVVTRYAGPDLGPDYARGRVQITLAGHTDAGLPRQIGMTYEHWAHLAAAVEAIGAEPDRAEAAPADDGMPDA